MFAVFKLGTQFPSSPFLLLNSGVDEVLGFDKLLSTSVKILQLASFVRSLTLLFSISKYAAGELMFVDIELEELF